MERGTAVAIIDAIDRAFQTEMNMANNEWKQNLVGMATDGASVMVGARSGVTTRVRQDVNHLVGIHCTAHKLELCLKSAMKQSPSYSKIEDFLIHIFKFYNNSPRNFAALKEAGNAHMIRVLKPSNVLGTRWIDHHKRAIIRDWLPNVTHMQDIVTPGSDHTNDSKNKAHGFLANLKDFCFIKSMYILLDVYRNLGRLSLLFQRNDTSLQSVKNGIQQAIDNFRVLAENPGPSETEFNEILAANGGMNFHGGITLNETQRRRDQNADPELSKVMLINACIDQINTRFRSFDDDPILDATKVFDPSNWPQNRDALRTYGVAQINTLVTNFRDLLRRQPDFSEDDVALEWTGLKPVVSAIVNVDPRLRFLDIWQRVLRQNLAEFHSILLIVKIVLLIPIHTSECERGFSVMGRIKSDWRATLNTDTLSDLIRIALDGPRLEDFDLRRAIERWFRSCQRHPYILPYGQREDSSSDDE
ncbi:zinc finger protein 862-like [Ptychodera flava]|uniref:zinc finger protein 862-like n=1 Tax=Ptychodera flava TaxID=63121 RepID=UPI00396A4681